MRDFTQKKPCVTVIGSMTQAMRAQKVLAASSIRAEIIKAEADQSRKGCSYALSYSCSEEWNVQRILRESGVLRGRREDGGA